jgi:hypothetical protein
MGKQMTWKEIHTQTRQEMDVSREKARSLEEEKKGLPKLQQEADQGVKSIEPMRFQPVNGTDHFESEFGIKGDDIIFHFWPWKYHENERNNRPVPRFPKKFPSTLVATMGRVFDPMRIEIFEDRDVGAWFVKAVGYGSTTFHRDLSLKAITELYKALGGEV